MSLLFVAALSTAFADPVDLELRAKAQQGQGKPALVLKVNADATRLDVTLRCGGDEASRSGAAKAGEEIVLELSPPVGKHSCTGRLSAAFADGSEGELPLSFQVSVLPPLVVEVPRDSINLDAQTLEVTMDRPPGRVEITAYGPGGEELGHGEALAGGLSPGERVEARWRGEGEVVRLQVRGYDEDGFWAAVDLFPWSYAIPHEDVVFDSGQHLIPEAEAHKLSAALAEIRAVEARYGDFAEVRLYVAGYTDSVGSAAKNQGLSERRAQAIAAWFREAGFTGEIWYQGFGESALAVATADEVDEPANRRALYLVAAEAPPVSTEVPRASWQRLR